MNFCVAYTNGGDPSATVYSGYVQCGQEAIAYIGWHQGPEGWICGRHLDSELDAADADYIEEPDILRFLVEHDANV